MDLQSIVKKNILEKQRNLFIEKKDMKNNSDTTT